MPAPIVATGVSRRGRDGGVALEESGDQSPALRGSSGGGSRQLAHVRRATSVAQNQRAEVVEADVAQALSSGGGKPGQGYPMAHVEAQPVAPTQKDDTIAWANLENGEPVAGGPSPTVTGGGGNTMPHVLHDSATGQEVPWGAASSLDPAPDGRRYQACGDGVAAPCATWIGLRLLAVMTGLDPDSDEHLRALLPG